jgi:transcriptional regulator with XRE-family HTH domain
MQIDELREALRIYRLSRGLSYPDLAADMAAALGPRAPKMRTLYDFLAGRGKYQPFETTQYAIAEFLRVRGVEIAA